MPAVIFDIDGTLLDSVDVHARSWREAFLAFGKDMPFGPEDLLAHLTDSPFDLAASACAPTAGRGR